MGAGYKGGFGHTDGEKKHSERKQMPTESKNALTFPVEIFWT